MDFTGFPVAALDFYDDLEVDNTKSFWDAHKHVWEESVKGPMTALCAALEPEFGTAKIFRPYRDVRFSKDKTPYKTHQGAFVAQGPATGFYVELSPRGLRTGGGFYEASGTRLAAYREAAAHELYGPELERLVADLEAAGFERNGDRLKTSPRGFEADHPRIDLLRHRSLTMGHMIGFEPVIHTAEALDVVREDWRRMVPFVEWVRRHVQD
ncbi:DUF2461 domain-containing protein [Nocardioides sp. GY 10127]|uniref:DUF2461 domain-containing protein n=1 Tax=Nocardioides sp. GY 10127 TaxID=2569762 RepID=UPI0010A78F0A|nr:DUF2461 domain-containing protein [Nocardioides sp. GY 10127]TIC82932.1 DUF2461 domain-containing protein [Nocardioides sp. GY 10127]